MARVGARLLSEHTSEERDPSIGPAKYADTEGWGWQAWEGGDKTKPALKASADQKVCSTCHLNEVKQKGMVFSDWSE